MVVCLNERQDDPMYIACHDSERIFMQACDLEDLVFSEGLQRLTFPNAVYVHVTTILLTVV